jgi:hypothetical protein
MILGSGEGGMFDSSVLAAPLPGPDGKGLLAAGAQETLPLELFVYALDSAGGIGGFLTYEASIELGQARATLERSGLKFFGHLDLPPGTYDLRVLARHRDSGEYSLRGVPLTVPDFSAGKPVLLPPLVAEPFDRWMITRQPGLEARPYPFMLAGQPFLPAARPALVPGRLAPTILLGYGLADDTLITGRVLADQQPPRNATIRVGERTPATTAGGAQGISIEVDPGQLAAGEYRLEITVVDPDSGESASSRAPFVVR